MPQIEFGRLNLEAGSVSGEFGRHVLCGDLIRSIPDNRPHTSHNGQGGGMDNRQRKWLEEASNLVCAVLESGRKDQAETFDTLILARALCRNSLSRDRKLPAFPGVSPPWRVLLLLHVAQADGTKISVSDLALLSDMPQTTNLRVQSLLMNLGLIQRLADPVDRRRVWLTLTDEGRVQVLEVLKEFSAEMASM